MRLRTALACLIAAVAITGCASSEKKAETSSSTTTKVAAVNTTCPIGGDDFGKSPSVTRTVKGTTVGFCCANCSGKFDKMTDAEKDNVLNLAKANKVLGH